MVERLSERKECIPDLSLCREADGSGCARTVCGKVFAAYASLQRHVSVHTEHKLCQEDAEKTQGAEQHQVERTRARETQCRCVSESFQRHVRTHRGGDPHHSEGCGEAFTLPSVLQAQAEVHTQDKACHPGQDEGTSGAFPIPEQVHPGITNVRNVEKPSIVQAPCEDI